MTSRHDSFPLATGISKRLQGEATRIAAGEQSGLLEQVTPVTRDLLRFWFQSDYCDLRQLNFHQGQRDAILHIIFAHEVLNPHSLRELYEAVAPDALLETGVLAEVSRDAHSHPKYAAKMATGTGKTWVLNALLVWQYLNRVASPDDNRFTTNFLLVAPGLIVYDRLLDSFLGKERDGTRTFDTSDIYANRDLFIPENYSQSVLGFLKSAVVTKSDIGRKVTGGGLVAITNWHLLAGVEDPDFVSDTEAPGVDIDTALTARSLLPLSPGSGRNNSLEILDRAYLRGGPLESLKDLPDLLVFNDEAHHIHELNHGGEASEVEWQKSLTEIASTKDHRFVQVDFSATPFNEVGIGKKRRKEYFRHIVVDFDLNAAMVAGLVKALALDKRKDVAALPLDFRAERDEQRRIIGLSSGQRVMLRAGLQKLSILEKKFAGTMPEKHPKLLVVCEETAVTPHVVQFLRTTGLSQEDILAVDSNRKGEMSKASWDRTRQLLFDIDRHDEPKVIVSVLMLREGFDVNNICVIVPLRSSGAQILLEQTIGRGLRLMWRGDDQIDELKRETRERIANHLEPTNYFDVLFIVEHPAFAQFYDELLSVGLATAVGDDDEKDPARPTGDLESVRLRPGFEQFDFRIPFIVRDADEELRPPAIDPSALPSGKWPFDLLKKRIGSGDRFVSQDAQTGTQYGDYRVDGGVMTATGYNDYLSRMTIRIAEALGSSITRSAKQYTAISRFPLLQAFRPNLTAWLDAYIRGRLFDRVLDPLADENWRVLLIDDVAHGIAGVFATALTEATSNANVESAEVSYRLLSEVTTITVRSSSAIEAVKCIYPKLPIPTRSGGLERMFIEWTNSDTRVEAMVKIHEYRHSFVHRPYLKADGMPGIYSPDFLVRTRDDVFLVETKAQSALSDENVQRKQRAALAWCDQINRLMSDQRDDREWHYVLLGERTAREWRDRNARVTEVLDFARLRPLDAGTQEQLL